MQRIRPPLGVARCPVPLQLRINRQNARTIRISSRAGSSRIVMVMRSSFPTHPIPRVEGDLFIGRDNLADAMHGDRVLARVERRRPDGRAEGRVVQIVERENPTVVGLFRYGPHGNHVLPYDTRIQHEVLIPPGDELTPELRQKLGTPTAGAPVPNRRSRIPELDGAVVDAEITRFPKGGLAPAGRVLEILGRPGDIGVDVEIIIRKHHLPHVFPEEVLAEARSAPQQVSRGGFARPARFPQSADRHHRWRNGARFRRRGLRRATRQNGRL